MNDATKDQTCDLKLTLQWSNDQDHLSDKQRVVVELQSANGITVASLSVQSDRLLQAVLQKLNCYPYISPNGIVTIASDKIAEPLLGAQTITLDQLIAEGTSSDMLVDEPSAGNMLSELRARLLTSLELVEQAIASLPKD
jgi:hypothetical protein